MRRVVAAIGAIALMVTVVGVVSADDDHRGSFRTHLDGYHEVPAISTTGTGDLTLKVNSAGTQIDYTLKFASLAGGAAGAAHLHLAQPAVNGGVLAFLCGGSKPACPGTGGTVTGTITAADIQAIPGQGIAVGDLAAVLRAMRAGFVYVNVHTTTFPTGEIRGQIKGH